MRYGGSQISLHDWGYVNSDQARKWVAKSANIMDFGRASHIEVA